MKEQLQQFIEQHTPLINSALIQAVHELNCPSTLKESMLYSIEAGGKRIRPLLVIATLQDLGASSRDAYQVAAAVEIIHTYSLIHDDLPCMDDDEYRRGQLTNHMVYGEALAVLTGDALQSLAFELVSTLPHTSITTQLALTKGLAEAVGASGMVGGQVLDIEGENQLLTFEQLKQVHKKKTGALLAYCVQAGALLANASLQQVQDLQAFSAHIGLAFQIQDDILDITSTTEELGKQAGSDEESEKSTYPAILGLVEAKKELAYHHEEAKKQIQFLQTNSSMLTMIADYIVERSH